MDRLAIRSVVAADEASDAIRTEKAAAAMVVHRKTGINGPAEIRPKLFDDSFRKKPINRN